jgi:hypothetical protein
MAAAALVAAVSGALASSSWATSVRVPDDYYSVNYARFNQDPTPVRESVLNQIESAGFDHVRFTIPWTDVEPQAPVNGVHSYNYFWPDELMTELAQHGITGQPTMWKTPSWNVKGSIDLGCLQHVDSRTPVDLQSYGLAAKQVVQRYGPNDDGAGPDGAFWTENPSLPYRPIESFEIWNEPNLKGFWCPTPQPDRYAKLAAYTISQIRGVYPGMKIISGGMPLGSGSGLLMKPGAFMEKMLAERPHLAKSLTAIGVHVYPYGDLDKQLRPLNNFRKALRAGGLPDSTPLDVTELGWSTEGKRLISETDRVARYKTVPAEIPNTNCNIDGVVAHAWTTAEANVNDNQDFFGIANPLTGKPYHSGFAYMNIVAKMLGKKPKEAPHTFIDACPGMPELDHDHDGHTDSHDYYPYDPSKWQGPPGWDGPDPNAHKHARKSCRRWYRKSNTWVNGDHTVHTAILTACVARYIELKKAGELGPLRQSSRASCRASTPPVSHWHGRPHPAHHRRIAINNCTFKLIRKGFHLHLHLQPSLPAGRLNQRAKRL